MSVLCEKCDIENICTGETCKYDKTYDNETIDELKYRIRNIHSFENLKEILGDDLGDAIYKLVHFND